MPEGMKRTATALAGTLATLAFAAAPAQALTATTKSAADVTDTSVSLRGQLDPGLLSVTPSYYFEYGLTAAYGSTTPVAAFALPTTGKVKLVGLAPSTTYHYRVVASGLLSTVRGGDVSFTTLGTPAPSSDGSDSGSSGDSGSGSGSSSGSGDQGTDGSAGSGDQGNTGSGDNSDGQPLAVTVEANDDPAKPVLGATVGAAPQTGSVGVKAPGATDFSQLDNGAPIPVGSTIDARNGSVNVVTAVGNAGKVQTATFKGAVFQVKQSRTAGGLTDIYLRGGDFSSCRASRPAPSGGHLLAKKSKRHAVRKLWGHDHHGRFRTHGRGAIATVRGTTWVVADHCDGTRTSVLSGAVSVRDLHRHKTVLVHAGHSYFARTHR